MERKKSLINNKIFNYELDNLGYSVDQFSYGVSPLKKEKINNLKKQDWINLFFKLMSNFDIKDLKLCTKNKISISYAPFLQYVSKKIDSILYKYPEIDIPVSERKNMVDIFNSSLLSIVGKVMVIEINNFRKKHNFKTIDPKEQLIECLNIYFESERNFLDFYKKYSVCTKLLCMRTEYFINNFEFMLSAIENSKNEIKKILNIENINIEKMDFSVGDSHAKGKSVVILKIDSKKIVFKPKNLDVCKKIEDFIWWVNTNMNLLELKFPRGIYEKEYAFQEWIEFEECKDEKEVADYYERFGYLSAISYILSGTDFHYENIIANGQFPVIVDGETFFQNPPKINVEGGIEELVQREVLFDSVLSSALFPQYTNEDSNLDISGFSGDKQQYNKKVLQPKNLNSIDFKYVYDLFEIKKAKNIPCFKEGNCDPFRYRIQVIFGLRRMLLSLYEKKSLLIEQISFFKETKIRCVLKSTQTYGDLLEFSSHPNYCSEMREREKLFENIWAYPHEDKRIVKSELDDILYNDIPIFYTFVDSKNVIDSRGKIIENFFNKSGYEIVTEKINKLNKESIEEQVGLLIADLQLLGKKKEKNLSNLFCNPMTIVYDIESKLSDSKYSYFERYKNEVTWKTIQINSSGQHNIVPMNSDIYGGLSGIGLFYLKLYSITKNPNYYSEYHNCISTAKRISEYYDEYESAYVGALSPIYPLLLEDYVMGTSVNHSFIKKTFIRLDKLGFSKNAKIDWIDGLSSILKLSIECFNITGDRDYIPIIHRIFSKLLSLIKNRNRDEVLIGFAHGYSGVSLAMSYYYSLFPIDDIKDIIIELLEKEIISADIDEYSYWCAGSLGMLQARILIKNIIDSDVITEQIETIKAKINIKNAFTILDDSLCHGLAGFIYNHDIISNLKIETSFNKIDSIISFIAVNRLINQEYNIERVPNISTKGIFTGYAGIGISLIKILSKDTDNLLTISIY